MTTLEIVRLDSMSASTSGASGAVSPSRFVVNRQSSQSRGSAVSPTTPTAGGRSDSTHTSPAKKSVDYPHEIPISIIKSPSFSNASQLVDEKKVELTVHRSPPASPQLSPSDDIDYVLNTNNSSTVSDTVPDTGTLRFNKYGFMQKNDEANTNSLKRQTDTTTEAATTNGDEKPKAASTSSLATTTAASNGVPAITNLKDYLQNTDVDEFAEHLPIEVVRARETKWIEMLGAFDEWMSKRFRKIKSRCRKGIPQSMRSRAWMHLTGAALLKKQRPNYYTECATNVRQVDVVKYVEDIKKDLHRQFPSHEIFMRKEGRQMLFNVLKAYAVHNKEVGYCQAQGPIAALLLMHMPEEDAFWMLIQISDFYLNEYFKPGLEKVQIDGQALFFLFKRENQLAWKLMKSQGIDPVLYMTEWFMCVFARTLPWCTVLRVWDMFFCEGVKVLYRVGLYLMRSAFADKRKLQRCQQQGMYETLGALKNLPVEALREAELVKESGAIRVGEDELRRAFEKSTEEFVKQTNEMNKNRKQPPPQSSYVNQNKTGKKK